MPLVVPSPSAPKGQCMIATGETRGEVAVPQARSVSAALRASVRGPSEPVTGGA